MNDFTQTIIKFLVLIFVIYVAFRFILPFIFKLIGILLIFILRIVMLAAIIFVLFLLGKFIYQSYKNNG